VSEEEILVRLLDEYHARVARGERPDPEDMRDEAGELFDDFVALVEQERDLDAWVADVPEPVPATLGEYNISGELDRDQDWITYRAIHPRLSRIVALKVRRHRWDDDEERSLFELAVRAAQGLRHPHALHVYDAGVFGHQVYVAQRLVDGMKLTRMFSRLKTIGPPPFTVDHHRVFAAMRISGAGWDTAAFAKRMCAMLAGPTEAVHEYHQHGMVGLDIEPANLVLSRGRRLVLTGCDPTRRAGNAANPRFLSPEQHAGEGDIDGRSDIYAMGLVACLGLTQRFLFDDPDPDVRRRRAMQDDPPDPREFVDDLPADVAAVLNRALARRREDRYATAAEFARDLAGLAGSLSGI